MKKVIFIKNALLLTATALILRLAGIIFKVWLSSRLGSEGVGLYQLTLSLYIFISAFAGGGICTAVTRLCAERLALGDSRGSYSALKKGILLSFLISAVSLFLLFSDPRATFRYRSSRLARRSVSFHQRLQIRSFRLTVSHGHR